MKKLIVTLIFLRQFLQCMKRPAQNNVSSKLFPLSLFALILLSPRVLLCTLSIFKLCAQPLCDLIRFKSERPVQLVYSAVSVFAWQWASLEMLWLVFFKLWEKAASGLRATVSAVIQTSGILLPLCSPGARSPPRGQTLSGARDSLSFFLVFKIALCLSITGFIECKENVAVAWGSLRCFNSCC